MQDILKQITLPEWFGVLFSVIQVLLARKTMSTTIFSELWDSAYAVCDAYFQAVR